MSYISVTPEGRPYARRGIDVMIGPGWYTIGKPIPIYHLVHPSIQAFLDTASLSKACVTVIEADVRPGRDRGRFLGELHTGFWVMKCFCGEYYKVPKVSLTQKHVKCFSCGCVRFPRRVRRPNAEQAPEVLTKYVGETIGRFVVAGYDQSAGGWQAQCIGCMVIESFRRITDLKIASNRKCKSEICIIERVYESLGPRLRLPRVLEFAIEKEKGN